MDSLREHRESSAQIVACAARELFDEFKLIAAYRQQISAGQLAEIAMRNRENDLGTYEMLVKSNVSERERSWIA